MIRLKNRPEAKLIRLRERDAKFFKEGDEVIVVNDSRPIRFQSRVDRLVAGKSYRLLDTPSPVSRYLNVCTNQPLRWLAIRFAVTRELYLARVPHHDQIT